MHKRIRTLEGFFKKRNRKLVEKFLLGNFGPDKFPLYDGEKNYFETLDDDMIQFRGITIQMSNKGLLETYSNISHLGDLITVKSIELDTSTYLKRSLTLNKAINDWLLRYFPVSFALKDEMLSINHLRLLFGLRDNLIKEQFCYVSEHGILVMPNYTIEIKPGDSDELSIEYDPEYNYVGISVDFDIELEEAIKVILSSDKLKTLIESLKLSSLFEENEEVNMNLYGKRFFSEARVHMELDDIRQQLQTKLTKSELELLFNASESVKLTLKDTPKQFVEIEYFNQIVRLGREVSYIYRTIKTIDFAIYLKDEATLEVVRKNEEHPFVSL